MIYTFYSYKGGVGRSMALANIAENLHEKGLRVIMIDWDLEAPGLETFFCSPGSELDELRAHQGLVDMLVAYRNAYPEYSARRAIASAAAVASEGSSRAPAVNKEEQARIAALTRRVLEEANVPAFRHKKVSATVHDESPQTLEAFLGGLYCKVAPISPPDVSGELAYSPFGSYLQCIHPPDAGKNGVYLISAGARSNEKFSSYATTVQDFDWSEFYATYEGREYFSWFRHQLRAIADVVLIDSRTGVTEMGGVCTRHIPDVVIGFCAPNFQNVDGVVRIVTGLNKEDVKRARGERAVQALVVPTRIDISESDRLNEFSIDFDEKVERGGIAPELLQGSDRPLWNLQIPYIPRYNYREELVIGPNAGPPGPATRKLIEAYRKIALHLAILAPEDGRIRTVFAGEIQSAFPFLPKVAPQLTPVIPDSWAERPYEYQELKNALMRPPGPSEHVRVSVSGWTGSGKTTLVARVCRDPHVVRAYPDGILWLNGDRQWSADAAREWLSTALGVHPQTSDRGLQQSVSKRRYLLVADDVWSLSNIEEPLKLGPECSQVIITRNAAVANQFGAKVVYVGPLTTEQSLEILKGDQVELTEPNNPRAAIARDLIALPLGATLVRSALDRRLAQGVILAQAKQQLRDAFVRHDILAFDQLGMADRSTSIAQSLGDTISRLRPEDAALLISIAKAEDLPDPAVTAGLNSGSTAVPDSELAERRQHLADLGLIDKPSGQATVNPLIQAYLLIEGRLGGHLESHARKTRISSSADKQDAANPLVDRARQIIRGEVAPLDEIRALAEALKEARYFTYARQLFTLALKLPDVRRLNEAQWLRLVQRQALCTYRDPDLPAEIRFSSALALLESADLHAEFPSSETLGLAGAIHKYQWKLTGRRRDLERSVAWYGIGARRDVTSDLGYTGINAAFTLNLLAQQVGEEAPVEAASHIEQARAIRQRIVSELPPFAAMRSNAALRTQWWFLATLAEACFGLGRFSEARFWLREGLALNPPDWELESTTRQLVTLAIAQAQDLSEGSEAHRTLRVIFSDATYAVRGATIGKVGLALSGGGFRASLFHIGVLARMAELDMLRYVEVLSCVSGGSIVGAHYYLEVRRLLQEKPDTAITRDDYVEIVHRLERDFLAATRKNLRLRLFTAWWANLRSLVQPGYTRTSHLGWLFEKYIYSCVRDGHSSGRRWLNDLQIRPQGGGPEFNPKVDNWARSAKAPILLLNATALNTGHNWQFAVSWMGEPPLGASSSVDRNDILRRMYYWEAPLAHRRVALGQAVAASACVPSLFDPVEFRGLYPDRSIRLVDGGTHDNQGIVGLLEQECTVMLVSDASGQTSSENEPSGNILSVGFRSSNILMARVREAEYRELELLRRSSALNGFVFLHLKKDLEAVPVDWVDCQDPTEDETPARIAPLTTYGMPRPVQSRLAAIRTDLDSFSDTEAYTLMLSGYRMMTAEVQKSLSHLPFLDGARRRWDFLAVEAVALRTPGKELEHVDMLKQLSVGANQLFKVWRLQPILVYQVIIVALILVGILGVDYLRHALSTFCPSSGIKECGALLNLLGGSATVPPDRNVTLLVVAMTTLLIAAVALLGVAAASILLWLVHRAFRTQKNITVIATGLIVITVGWLVALVHLFPLNWLYLRHGRIKVPPRL
jgi:predicted acylesterase/phospholipase RssA